MRSIMSVSGSPMTWKQPHLLEPLFELDIQGEILASLKFKNSFGSYAEGTSAEGSWSFKRQGFLKTFVTIRVKGLEDNIAVYYNSTWSEGGTLEIPGKPKIIANSNFWHEQFEFTNEIGEPLIRYTQISGFKLHANMELFRPAMAMEDSPWMILLGWYLAVMTSRDGEMVAAVF